MTTFPHGGFFPPMRGPGAPIEAPVAYFQDFIFGGSATTTGPLISTTADAAEWLATVTNSAIPKIADNTDIKAITPYGGGGVLKIINAGTNDDKVSAQLNGEPYVVSKFKPIVLEGRFATSAIAGTLFCFGLSKTGTAVMAAGGQSFTVTDFIGFTVRGVAGAILPVVKGASAETLPAIIPTATPAFVNNTWTVLRLEINYNRNNNVYRVDFFQDGVLIATHYSSTAALPLDSDQTTPIGLTPTWEFKTQASAAHNGFIDYIASNQLR